MARRRRKKDVRRRAQRHRDYVPDEQYLDYVRHLTCLLWKRLDHQCQGVTEPAHVKTRGAGGKDWENTVPLCSLAHREQHQIGIESFQRKYAIDLRREARQVARDYAPEDLAF